MGLNEDDWLSLAQMRERVKESPWQTTRFFEQVGSALERGLLPSQFWAASSEDQTLVLAYGRVSSTMASYQRYLDEKSAKKK